MALVFQYGSNLSEERLNSSERLNGNATRIGIVYTTFNYELEFDIWSKTNNCAVANLIPNKGRRIYGVLYSISDDRVFRNLCKKGNTCLDKIEGEGRTYRREFISVALPDRKKVDETVITYLGINRENGLKTSKDYIFHIVNGLIKNNMPQDYIEYVIERIRHNNSEISIDELPTFVHPK